VKVTRCRKVEQKGKEIYQLVLDHTPFYPEGGGQVGDSGSLIFDGGEEVRIFDTKKENNLILHFTKNLPKNIRTAAVAKVDIPKRRATERNHSVTHLLHKALREILGSHVQQKGSLVHPDYLRFDFAHFSKVESEQLREVEVRVNELIRQDDALDENRNAPIKEAMEQGAMALFGEKYGDVVRTIRFGESVELCGGTHVSSTGKIGWFKITSEAAVASGIRRIEARTASKAMEAIYSDLDILSELRGSLNNSSDPLKAINDLLEERQAMGKQLESMEAEKLKSLFTDLLKEVEELDGIKTLIKEVDVDGKGLKDLIFRLKDSDPKLICVLASSQGEKVNLAIGIGAELLKAKKWNAGALISDWAKEIDGGGGGQAFYASAGGKKAAGIPTALSKAREFIKSS
jgi:alanyl-tRNA synthetase